MSEKNSTNQHNFPFEHEGKTLWCSRSVVVSCYTFARNPEGTWCILVNKRGPGLPNNVGLWNTVTGYLDFYESNIDAAIRETKEETGVDLPEDFIVLDYTRVNREGDQNVVFGHVCVLPQTTDNYPLSTEFCEPGEVDEVRWMPISEVDNYQWANQHNEKIKRLYDEHVGRFIPKPGKR